MANTDHSSAGYRLHMVRANLDELPPAVFRAGCRCRDFVPEDRAAWVSVVAAADTLQTVTEATFSRSFDRHVTEQPRRILVATAAEGCVVGTVAAWFARDGWGRVHWLAVRPEWQGRGVGRALLAAALGRLRDLGHDRAYLVTEARRLPAIRLYLGAGFQPQAQTESERAAWDRLARQGLEVRYAPATIPPAP